jgi:hypothetical protein
VGIIDGNNKNIPISEISKYVTVVLQVAKVTLDDLVKGEGDVKHEYIQTIFFKPCKDIVDKTLTDDFLVKSKVQKERDYFNQFMLCPDIKDPTDLFVLSSPIVPPFQKIDVTVYPCTLNPPTDCASFPDISKTVIKIASTVKNFVPENKSKNLIDTSIYYDNFLINPMIEIAKKSYLIANELFNEDQDFSKKVKMAEFVSPTEQLIFENFRFPLTSCTLVDIF